MKLDLIIENEGTIYYPIVEDGVTITWDRQGSPGVLKFTVIAKDISFQEGNAVKVTVDEVDMFYGFVFSKKRTGQTQKLIEVTVYDQLRYFKNKDTYTYENKKASEVIAMIAEDFGLNVGALEDTGHTIAFRTEDDVTLFDIAQNALDETLEAMSQMYVLYDDVGKLTLKNVESMKSSLLISEDTIGNFTYTSTIDSQTYNQIKITYENTETGERDIFIAKDSGNINSWGLLQYTASVEIPESGESKANALLSLYNSKTRNLTITDALGDTSIRAGSSVITQLNLGDIEIQCYLMVERVTHTFTQNQHMMTLNLRGGTFVS